jgi:polar amino acid transport system permease protein
MGYKFYWPVLWEYRGILWQGLLLTLQLFVIVTVLSLSMGILIGILGASRRSWQRIIAEVYVEFNRNIPIIVQLLLLYFALGMEALTASIIGLSIHQSAYMAEVVRSGIQSLPRGQFEAGFSTGLSAVGVLRYIILPQAFIIIIPPLTTQFVDVLKNSSIAMTITVMELTFQTQQIETLTFRGFEAATAVTILYLILSLLITTIMSKVEVLIVGGRTVSNLLELGRQQAKPSAAD